MNLKSFNTLKSRQARKFKDELSVELPETLSAISSAMQSGYTLNQAIIFVSKSCPRASAHFLKQIIDKVEFGYSIQNSLGTIENFNKENDIKLFATTLKIQIENGGNTIEVLNKISAILRQKIQLRQEIKSLTAQGRYSGIIIAGLCPVSIFLFSVISPEYISPLYSTRIGNILLILALLFAILGFKSIANITNIDL